jgi:organic hydroperoxide reductase OsmC/OhrA
MSRHVAEVRWTRGEQDFLDQRYGRAHEWRFDGGAVVRGAASPHRVPARYTDPAAVDPEEAFVASVSSCHMLWFLSLAARAGYRVDAYVDQAEGEMGSDAAGRMAITCIRLRPVVTFSGARQPDASTHDGLHHAAHESCFIANSVKCEIRCEPVIA